MGCSSVRLINLDPRWLTPDVFIFRNPTGGKHWLTCPRVRMTSEEQRQLFAVLNCAKRIGLTLTDGLMMAPSKSVTAIIGLSEDAACVQNKCMTCSNINCPYRDTDIKKV